MNENLENLIDTKSWVGFYGVDGNRFKLGRRVYEAIEDESDGYRSCLDCIQTIANPGDIFFKRALAKVRVEKVDDWHFQGYRLIDSSGHVWLRAGTSNWNGYYPYFTFEYLPKQPK